MSIEAILSTCNKQAMEFLCSKNYLECYKLLQKAENIIESPEYITSSRLAAITWNNLACYYKRINLFDQALEYLTKSLKVEDLEQSFMAEIHLNIMAVLKEQKKYETALFHGTKALELLNHSKKYITLIPAIKNTAGVYLALGKIEKALHLYSTSLKLAEDYLGENDSETLEIREKIRALKNIEKKFYFEKAKIKENKRYLSHLRNNDKAFENFLPIKESKSLERSPKLSKKVRIKKSNKINQLKSTVEKRKLLIKRVKIKEPNQFSVLEAKIKGLQNQLDQFENRYNNLENFSMNLKPESKNKIQDSKGFKKSKIKQSKGLSNPNKNEDKPLEEGRKKLVSTLKEFETLKKLAETEELFGDDMRSKLTSANAEKSNLYNTIGFSLQKISLKPC
jgi:tetratricopeptide (TPR) repeat protein